MAGRYVENVACLHFDYAAIVHGNGARPETSGRVNLAGSHNA
jgi:hypothetical protein